ncbi:NAD-dependent epimerase/dehydratase family protein [Terrimonas sp. NA20]|uniref:NAD-dependent epimerase/dehydratase family protein n=1 Tax=Terrimonas ginsenosidimutans TaxID=2908004 RepID=A0ABS9KNX0_9BACT|nr:NAD-dependent epimerase/dehydratase family protein [Terrimonas ginsenosidimutans]MCG2613989.1 NAD-dependent epimerase/dehydratase family protein [Terrimonas ginsenosidimutans]
MSKKVLLLGGAGFIGFNITRFLAENRDYSLTIADNFARGKQDELFTELVNKHNVRVIAGDYTDPKAYDQLDEEYDQLYMLASVVGVDNANSIPHEIIRINTALIYNTLEWMRRAKIGKVLFTSTSECYAGTVDAFGYTIPTPEQVPLCIEDIGHPRFTYAVTKMLGESGFLNYGRMLNIETTIVRYHNVYGPRMGFKHVIPHLAIRFRQGETPFKVYGHDQTRAFCYITDAVKGTVLAMEQPNTNGEIYHIGTQEEISIGELIHYTGELMHFNGEYENAPTYPGSVSRRCPDITKARTQLGFEPEVSWKDGLKQTIGWYNEYLEQGKKVYE